MADITFKPKAVVKRLLTALPKRAREVIEFRYGLLGGKPMTLEAIGKRYTITRERVRQIENYALTTIRKSEVFKKEEAAFAELANYIDSVGSIVCEDDLFPMLSKDIETQNYLRLLLTAGDPFKWSKEDDEFKQCWFVDHDLAQRIRGALRSLYQSLSDEELISEAELIDRFFKSLHDLNERYKNEEVARRWLSLSKTIGKNPLGEWGRSSSPHVRLKGIRDYAYLVIKRHGSPMHFREVAKSIEQLFHRKAHEATCHNELIKDPRFVLVGRGLYALSEWGYINGVVKDVIRSILQKHGPLTREQVIDRVRKERYVKDNTILVNLQNSKYFKRNQNGTYTVSLH